MRNQNNNPWPEYEREKRKIIALNLPPEEYETAIQELGKQNER